MGAVTDANSGIYLQTFSVQSQLSNEALRLLIRRQRSILPGEVGLGIRQGFDFIGPKRGSGTLPVIQVCAAVNPVGAARSTWGCTKGAGNPLMT